MHVLAQRCWFRRAAVAAGALAVAVLLIAAPARPAAAQFYPAYGWGAWNPGWVWYPGWGWWNPSWGWAGWGPGWGWGGWGWPVAVNVGWGWGGRWGGWWGGRGCWNCGFRGGFARAGFRGGGFHGGGFHGGGFHGGGFHGGGFHGGGHR
jgi:hypothetical protein